MRRKTTVLVLTLALVAVPTLGAPATDRGSWSWTDLVSGLVDQVVQWVTGADEVDPDGNDEVGGWLDPNGYQVTEPEPPTGEGGPWVDPNGIQATEPEPPTGEVGPWIDPDG